MVYAHMLALYAYCMRYSIYARMCDPMSPSHIPLSSPRRLSACLRLAYLSVDWQLCCFVYFCMKDWNAGYESYEEPSRWLGPLPLSKSSYAQPIPPPESHRAGTRKRNDQASTWQTFKATGRLLARPQTFCAWVPNPLRPSRPCGPLWPPSGPAALRRRRRPPGRSR